MYEFTTTVMNDEEYVQCLKPDGLNRKQIARPDLVAMLSQKLSPTERGRSTIGTAHVSGGGTRTYLKAKTRQFRLDSALSPQGIFPSQTADEFPELGLNFPAPSFGVS